MKRQIFLSGAMRGVKRSEALRWREDATKKLLENFCVFNPYQGREEKETIPDPRLAIIRDKNQVLKSDVLLVNDSFENVPIIGTSMEILLAFQNNIPVIVFGSANIGNYFLDYHVHTRVDTLEEALSLINTFFK